MLVIPRRRQRQILLAEDHEDTAELFKLCLSDYCVDSVASGEAALVRSIGHQFDLFLLDLHLPDVPGDELCRKIRSRDPNTPIIVCTADALPDKRKSALSAGAQACLVKPVEPQELLLSVRRELDASDLRSIAATTDELGAMLQETSSALERATKTLAESAAERTRALERIASAKRLIDRAKETAMRARAFQSFIEAGGVPAHFEDLWPDVLERYRVRVFPPAETGGFDGQSDAHPQPPVDPSESAQSQCRVPGRRRRTSRHTEPPRS